MHAPDLSDVPRDARHALRRFRSRPFRSGVGVLTLAVGIGASTAAFGAVRALLLEPLPVRDQDDLALLWQRSEARAFDHVPFLPRGFEAVRSSGAFPGVAAVETAGARPGLGEGEDGTFPVNHVRVGGDWFGVLGTPAWEGRMLDEDDAAPGAPPAVVISHGFRARHFADTEDVVGRTLRYEGVGHTVVGVAPPGFEIPSGAEAWAPLEASAPGWSSGEVPGIELDLLVRLPAGMEPNTAVTAVEEILERDPAARPSAGAAPDLRVVAVSLPDEVLGTLRPVLALALAAALALLLVAVANATLLFLAGGLRTSRSIALRRALGATGRRAVRPLVADAALQAVLGWAVGVALAAGLLSWLVPFVPVESDRVGGVGLDGGSLAFAGLLALTALVGSAGVAGAWYARLTPGRALLGGRVGRPPGDGLRRGIAAGQIALAVVAATAGGILIQSVRNLEALDRGFRPEGLFVVTLHAPFSFFAPPEGYRDALIRAAGAVGDLPGVEGASPTFNAPLVLRGGIDFVPRLESQSVEEAAGNPYVGFDAVLPEYFETAGTEIVEGRGFGPEDGPDDPPTAVVNRAAAEALWPGRSAVGQRVAMGGLSRDEIRTVVGVAEDHRFRTFPEVRPALYLPLSQFDRFVPGRFLVRADPTAGPLRQGVEGALAAQVPGVRVLTVQSMTEVMEGPLRRPRFTARILVAFGALTLLLAGIGVQGVLSVLLAERRRDFGVRIALGARPRHVAQVMGRALLPVVLTGAVTGGVAVLFARGWLEGLTYEVSVATPRVVLGVMGCAVGLALGAAIAPTLRALGTDPAESLRAE